MVLHRVFPVKSLLDNLVNNWSRNVLPVWLTRDCIQCKFVPWCLLLLYLSYSVQKYCYSLNLFVKCQLWDSERCLVNYWSYGLPVTRMQQVHLPSLLDFLLSKTDQIKKFGGARNLFFSLLGGTNHTNLYKNLIKIQIFNVNLGAMFLVQ